MRQSVNAQASGIMLLLCFVWGMQQVAIKAIVDDMSPMLQVSVRSGVAAVLVWLVGRYLLREPWLRDGAWRSGMIIGVLFAAEFMFVAEGLRWTSASHMAVFLYTAPIFAALGLHWRLPEERLSRIQWGGILLAFAGIAVAFLWQTDGGNADPDDWLLGDFLGLCAGATWGATTVVVRISRLSEAPPTQTLFYQLLVAFVLLLAIAVMTQQVHFHGTGLVWASLGFQALVVCFISYLTWFWLLRRYLAAQLGVLSFGSPLFGVLLGVWLLNEHISVSFAFGALMVIAGLLTVTYRAWWPLLRSKAA